jgi:hypothetical protein
MMPKRVLGFWIVTAANIVLSLMTVPLLSDVMLSMAGFAAVGRSSTLLVFPLIGVVLSAAGLYLSKDNQTDMFRRLRIGVHTAALVLYCLVLIGYFGMPAARK